MILERARKSSFPVALLGAAALALAACGQSPPGNNGGNGGSGGNGMGGSGGTGMGGNGGTGMGGMGGTGMGGMGGGSPPPPPPTCAGMGTDAPAQALDFSNNLIASPAPPGNLPPSNAPQIVVFGWDDIESSPGVAFVNQMLGSLTNPDNSKGSANVNPNACYAEGWGAPDPNNVCGDGTIAQNRGAVTMAGFDMGNHTWDHLEPTSKWPQIPAQYKAPSGGWMQSPDGFGVGVLLDQQTWQTILMANHNELKTLYGVSSILGFRAPRLELNDNGLLALKAINYQYDETLEEIMPAGFVDAAIAVDTGNGKGFNFIPWPYTLDNGAQGIWNQQVSGDKKWVTNFPQGLWEIPVSQVYVPTAGGLGKTIANRMLNSDNPMNCTFPAGTPADQMKHCFLSDGELNPGDVIKEVTAFDFNTFVYSRFTHDDWLAIMKYTFLMRYYGNRAPLTYGAHPVEYTDPYDSFTLAMQANNFGYRDVTKFNTYMARQQAMLDFVAWIKGDATLSKDTYFLSAKQLADYMTKPFDKTGAMVGADAVAMPDSNGLFTRLMWTGAGATINVVSGNAADIVFNVVATDMPVSVKAGIKAGALSGVSPFDCQYNSEVPFRVRLLTSDGSLSRTVLLAGVGGDRTARIRVKDFFPGPEALAGDVAAASLVDATYMGKVAGIQFESAATMVTGAKTFNTHIKQITLHGVATANLCGP